MSDDPIGDWYRRKDEKARRLSEELKEVIKQEKPEKEIKRIKAQLELARYVGD